MRDASWLQGMQAGHRNIPECTAAFSATDSRPDLDKFDVPTHVIDVDEDQVVPFEVGGKASAACIRAPNTRSIEVHRTALRKLTKEEPFADVLAFLNS